MTKTALIFGEKDYKFSKPLSNPINDAQNIADSLKKLGFVVNVYCNDDYNNMVLHINEWYKKIDQYDVALFYYSGHGIEYEGENYLLPIDSDPKQPSDLHHVACSANAVLNNMENNKTRINIMILDACRDNPFLKSWTRSIGTGLEEMRGDGGSFVGYAASPGKVAREGKNRNGLYTESLLKYLTKPNTSIYDLFTLINIDVRRKTIGAQIPYMSSTLGRMFCFNPEDKLSFLNVKKSSTIQTESSFVLSADGEYFFREENNKLIIQQTKNYNNIDIKNYNVIRPYKIMSGLNNIYIIDTTGNYFYTIDFKRKQIKGNVKLSDTPIAFTVDNRENKAYILYRTSQDSTNICVIDLLQQKRIKNITVHDRLEAIRVSLDNNYLYANSSYNAKKRGLHVIDTRTGDVLNFIEGIACGQALGVSSSSKKIYTSNINLDKIDQVNIIESSSMNVLKTVNFKPLYFQFTSDKKYILAVGMQDILIIDALRDEYLGKIKLDTKIGGLAITDSNYVFTFLPSENRILSFSLLQKLQKDSSSTYDSKFKRVQEKIAAKNLTDPQFKANEILTKANLLLFQVTGDLIQSLGSSFDRDIPDYIGPNFNLGTLICHFGIMLKNDGKKRIFPLITIKVDSNYFIMTIEENDVKEVYTSPNRSIDWGKISELIKTFYLDRSNQLGL